jgi:hypothetical protein
MLHFEEDVLETGNREAGCRKRLNAEETYLLK